LADAIGRPLVYRSHAIETQYHEEYFRLRRAPQFGWQAHTEAHHDRLQLRAISRLEQLVVARSALTLEISADDLRARQRSDQLPIIHFPPLVSSPATVAPARRHAFDVCYVGNLFMPNNQEGLLWFLREVLPIVLDRLGPLRVVVAGKTMNQYFDRHVRGHGVDMIPNPADVDEIIANSTVGVNPIFAGNGTTLKTLDYLWSGCGVVTSPIGVQGFRFGDSSIPLTVAGAPESFATALVERLASPRSLEEIRAKLMRFSWEVAGPRLAGMLASV
jgi:hypothetical protein